MYLCTKPFEICLHISINMSSLQYQETELMYNKNVTIKQCIKPLNHIGMTEIRQKHVEGLRKRRK